MILLLLPLDEEEIFPLSLLGKDVLEPLPLEALSRSMDMACRLLTSKPFALPLVVFRLLISLMVVVGEVSLLTVCLTLLLLLKPDDLLRVGGRNISPKKYYVDYVIARIPNLFTYVRLIVILSIANKSSCLLILVRVVVN